MRILVSVVTIVLVVAAGCADTEPEPRAGSAEAARVVRVVDGDTLIVSEESRETTIRLLGIDTPEAVKPGSPVECFGPEASRRARELLPRGSEVRVETDPSQDRVDDFGRTLAYVYPEASAVSVNERMVEEGFARVFIARGEPFRRESRFTELEAVARDAELGLWGACRLGGEASEGISPEGRSCPASHPIKGNLPSRIYHQPGDPDFEKVNPERCFTNAASAEADGFRPVRGR